MKKNVTIGFVLVLVIAVFTIPPVNVTTAKDYYVKSDFPKYEVVVGKDITFKWHLRDSGWTQKKFELVTSHGTVEKETSAQEYTWKDFPYGSHKWYVKVRIKWKAFTGRTSEQNFYHLNTEPDQPTPKVGAFIYRDGPRGGLADTTLYYEVLRDYSVNLAEYFASNDKTPNKFAKYDNTKEQIEALRSHLLNFPDIEWDFIILKDGILTIKEGYRWDGASTPWNTLNIADNRESYIRCSCVHDAMYDLMRMGYLESDRVGNDFEDPGFKNRLIADCMIYMINVEDGRALIGAQADFIILRGGGFGKTHKDKLLAPWKYHISDLTARVSDGTVELNWKPADITGKDPKDYGIIGDIDSTFTYRPHTYNIFKYKVNSSLPSWDFVATYQFKPDTSYTYDERDVFVTDTNVIEGETYYYWVRSADSESGLNWQDRHHDESTVIQILVEEPLIPNLLYDNRLYSTLIVFIGVILVKFGKRKTGGLLMILGVSTLLYVLLENPPSLFDYLGDIWSK